MDCSPPGSSVHGDSPGKNTGVGCHALLQAIVPTQGLNLQCPTSPALQADSLPAELPGKTLITCRWCGNLTIMNKNTDVTTRRGKEHFTWIHRAQLQPPLCQPQGADYEPAWPLAARFSVTRLKMSRSSPSHRVSAHHFSAGDVSESVKMLHPTSLFYYFQQVFTSPTVSEKITKIKNKSTTVLSENTSF